MENRRLPQRQQVVTLRRSICMGAIDPYHGGRKPEGDGFVPQTRTRKNATLPHIILRLDFGNHGGFGPGKIELLEAIDRLGSIAAAGRDMNMSYRRAWLLVESINTMFDTDLVTRARGGAGGGGHAALTALGRRIVTQYRHMERETEATVRTRLRDLQRALPAVPRRTSAG